jgi:chromosome segregation ATPase
MAEEKTSHDAEHERQIHILNENVEKVSKEKKDVIKKLESDIDAANARVEERDTLVEILNKNNKQLQDEINEKKENNNALVEKNTDLKNELSSRMKLIDEINKIISKNNLYFEQTRTELASNKEKIEELTMLCSNLNEELILKNNELISNKNELTEVYAELELARNDYIIKKKLSVYKIFTKHSNN